MEYENINKRQQQQEGLGKAFLNKSRLRQHICMQRWKAQALIKSPFKRKKRDYNVAL